MPLDDGLIRHLHDVEQQETEAVDLLERLNYEPTLDYVADVLSRLYVRACMPGLSLETRMEAHLMYCCVWLGWNHMLNLHAERVDREE